MGCCAEPVLCGPPLAPAWPIMRLIWSSRICARRFSSAASLRSCSRFSAASFCWRSFSAAAFLSAAAFSAAALRSASRFSAARSSASRFSAWAFSRALAVAISASVGPGGGGAGRGSGRGAGAGGAGGGGGGSTARGAACCGTRDQSSASTVASSTSLFHCTPQVSAPMSRPCTTRALAMDGPQRSVRGGARLLRSKVLCGDMLCGDMLCGDLLIGVPVTGWSAPPAPPGQCRRAAACP